MSLLSGSKPGQQTRVAQTKSSEFVLHRFSFFTHMSYAYHQSASNLCCDRLFPGNPPSKPIKKTIKQRFLKLLPCYRSSSSSSTNQSKCVWTHWSNRPLIWSQMKHVSSSSCCWSGRGVCWTLASGNNSLSPHRKSPR